MTWKDIATLTGGGKGQRKNIGGLLRLTPVAENAVRGKNVIKRNPGKKALTGTAENQTLGKGGGVTRRNRKKELERAGKKETPKKAHLGLVEVQQKVFGRFFGKEYRGLGNWISGNSVRPDMRRRPGMAVK